MMSKDCPPTLAPLRFQPANTSTFAAELRSEAQAYLLRRGDHRHANGKEYAKGGFLVLAASLPWALAMHADTTWVFITAYVGFALLVSLLSVNFTHTASHYAIFRPSRHGAARSRLLHRLLTRIVTLPLGIEPEYWATRHVYFHHVHPNIEHYDLDIEANFFLRQTPFQPWRAHQRYQQFYWPIIAALSMLYVALAYDWSDRLGRTPLKGTNVLRGPKGWVLFVGSKLAHFGFMIALPLWLLQNTTLGWGSILIAYLLAQLCASFFIVALLLGTHWAEVEFFLPSSNGTMPHTWYEHTLRTSVDWMPGARWVAPWMGGLNRHLTHHLFPTWHPRHYDALSAIVARLARKHQLPYRELTHRELFHAQFRFLKAMGRAPESA